MTKKLLIIFGILIVAILIMGGNYVYKNLNYDKPLIRKTQKAGFVEKQVTLDDGTFLNYAEGPDNGIPLLMIHGQMTAWPIYMKVLPELSKRYHIFAVDCHGHGKSSKDTTKYSAEAMGNDLARFIETVIGEPAVVTGNSSGGLLAAWLAANAPDQVLGIVLEDPPFFSTEPLRCEKSFAWIDFFKPCHAFLEQDTTDDFALYYLKNSYWITFFGTMKEKIISTAEKYRAKNPDKRLVIYYLPPAINNSFYFIDSYDPRFGDTFYDCSWLENYDYEETLPKIKCPSVLIHANWKINEEGILLGAMSGEDTERAHNLIKNNELIDVKSGHAVSFDKPEEMINILTGFLEKLEK